MAHSLPKHIEAELRGIAGNGVCVDCDERNPQWASVSLGVFMCLECSGRHRALGVHISFVRSVSMDSWSEKQIQMMRVGGNDKCNAFLAEHGVRKNTPIPQKYNTPAAMLYKDRVSAAAEGRPLPTQLPQAPAASHSTVAQGSDPLPGESEADYVARQRKLQDEARERMRAKFGGSTGLNSGGGGGKLAGIGSDASYRPGGGGGGGGGLGVNINAAEVTAQLSEVSKNAMSFLSSTVATLSDKVQKVQLSAREGPHQGGGHAPPYNDNTDPGDDGRPPAHATSARTGPGGGGAWGAALSVGAASLWAKAATATSEIVKDLTKPPSDEDFKFPRPPTEAEKQASAERERQLAALGVSDRPPAAPSSSSSSSSSLSAKGRRHDADDDEWGDEPPSLQPRALPPRPERSGRSISAEVFDDAFAEPSSSTRGKNGSGAGSAASSVKGMSLSGGRETDAATTAATAPGSSHKRSTSNASVASAASTGSAGSSGASGGTPAKAKPPAPVGDDFFKTFGV